MRTTIFSSVCVTVLLALTSACSSSDASGGGAMPTGGGGGYSSGGGSPGGSSAGGGAGAGATTGTGGGSGSAGAGATTGSGSAGELTAGDWDDNANFGFFQSYLKEAPSQETLNSSDRVVITVQTPEGDGVSNAWVTVTSGGAKVLEAPTASDGRILFFPAHDGAQSQSYSVTVQGAPGSNAPTTTFDEPVGSEWTLTLPNSTPQKPLGLDLAFVMDATGSMGDEIDYLKAEIDEIAAGVAERYPNVKMRFALMVYRDDGDTYVTKSFDFANLDAFKQSMAPQAAGGGGDYEEAMDTALAESLSFSWSADNSARITFLIADAPPHAGQGLALLESVDLARKLGIKLYPVAASGTNDRTELLMRQSAQWTLGRYLFITDDSGIGGSHAEPHIPCYEVSHLNNLMKRVIYSELEGKYVPSDPADVIRTVGDPEAGVCKGTDQDYYLY